MPVQIEIANDFRVQQRNEDALLVDAAPGQDIKAACGASFGQLISAAKSTGTAVHSNYAGGANAFSDPAILAAHGCDG